MVTTEEATPSVDPAAVRMIVELAIGPTAEVLSIVVRPEDQLVLVSVNLPPTLGQGERLTIEAQVQGALRAIEEDQKSGYVFAPVFPPLP